MICTVCWGKGWTRGNCGEKVTCPACHGSGKVEQTNEEWLCGLDTEDKAREISDMTAQGYWEEELVYKWLKEKHE